jgi:hypothetical protein
MPVLVAWCWFAAGVLIISLLVHVSTFLGIDPMEKWPGVMFIHLAIFPPFIAALFCANRTAGPKHGAQDRVMSCSPLWLKILTGVCFAYALVNFAVFIVLIEGGSPRERDGKYFLHSHGTVLRELSEAEFHQMQAFVVRGFSGHWMLFSSAALMVLVGTARLRSRSEGEPPLASGNERIFSPSGMVNVAKRAETADADPAPDRTSVRGGVVSLVIYVACLALILSNRPALGVVAVPPVTIAMVLAMRRRWFLRGGFKSCIGCLAVFPNGVIASVMGKLAAEFIYLATYVGLGPALRNEVAVTFPKEGPAQLSNGELLHTQVWAALMILVMFPLFAIGTGGLTYLAEQVGRLTEAWRREHNPGSGF